MYAFMPAARLLLEPPNELLVGRVVLLGSAVGGERCRAGTTRGVARRLLTWP
jgi:hypothetical protein